MVYGGVDENYFKIASPVVPKGNRSNSGGPRRACSSLVKNKEIMENMSKEARSHSSHSDLTVTIIPEKEPKTRGGSRSCYGQNAAIHLTER